MRNLRSRIVVSEQWLVVSCVSCLLVLAIAGVWHLATLAFKFRVLAPSGGSKKLR